MSVVDFCINYSDIFVSNSKSFVIAVEFYYESPIKSTEDEPYCPEYFELLSVKPVVTTYFANNTGISMSITNEAEMLNFLTDAQVESIINCIKEEQTKSLRYVDNDILRPSVSGRMQRQLGFGLKDYERE